MESVLLLSETRVDKGGKLMPFFRKKPVVVEASQWHKHGDHPQVDDVWAMWMRSIGEFHILSEWEPDAIQVGRVKTPEGVMTVTPGDWVITGVAGECYPCKPEIFDRTYDPA